MPGLIVNGIEFHVPGLEIRNWHDDPALRLKPEDGRPRTEKWVRSIVVHTTVGDLPQEVRSYTGPRGLAARTVSAWGNDSAHPAGAHLIIDGDGSIYQLADLLRDVTYHAGKSKDGRVRGMNEASIGIEMAQGRAKDAKGRTVYEIYQPQIANLIRLIDRITQGFIDEEDGAWIHPPIARQIQWPYLGEDHPVGRLAAGGMDCCGVFGHRDQTFERGPGDPGDAVPMALLASGYEGWNFDIGEDLKRVSLRQRQANAAGAKLVDDGVPGPATAAAWQRFMGKPHGLWISRPGDDTDTTAA